MSQDSRVSGSHPASADEAVKDQGALTKHHPSFTDKDFEGHRLHTVFLGLHVPTAADGWSANYPESRRSSRHHRHRRHHHHSRGAGQKKPTDEQETVIRPSQRVQFILGTDDDDGDKDHESHPIFSELEQLHVDGDEMEWREAARWIKFEEDVEEGGNRWSKPHVGTLSLHSLFELRSFLLNGTVLLDMEAVSLDQIADLILDQLVNQKLLNDDNREKVKEALLRRHRHLYEKGKEGSIKQGSSRMPLIRSLADIGRVHSASKTPSNDGSTNGHNGDTDGSTNVNLASLGTTSSAAHISQSEISAVPSNSSDIHLKGNQHFMKKIPVGAEASNILVGEVNFVDQTLAAFVRLKQAVLLGDLTEVPVPTRFLFVLLGPIGNMSGFHEIGRAIATLMADEVFHDVAYKAKSRQDLIAGVDEFLDAVTVLPPGEWDPSIRIEPPSRVPSQIHRKAPDQNAKQSDKELEEKIEEEEEKERECSGLKRTGRLFGGLRNDLKRKVPFYLSDFRDAFALQCLASFFFLYFACLTPIITFGGLLGEATEGNMAAIESLVSGLVCGIFYGFFSGQPLTILSSTGPVLVFETIAYAFCKDNGLEYLSFRLWIGLWTGAILIVLVAVDASALVCYITRFTEENFACLISLIFIYNAVIKLFQIGNKYPIEPSGGIFNRTCKCTLVNDKLDQAQIVFGDSDVLSQCRGAGGILTGPGCDLPPHKPDVFLMSILLFLLTFFISFGLKELKTSPFFPAKVRHTINDFAVMIGILSMTVLDYVVGLETPKLDVPADFKPTNPNRGWLIPFFGGNPTWTAFAGLFPALLATILIFMDQQITAVIVNRKEHKLKKGCGYHLDLFVLAILIIFCSIFGLPWFVAGTVLAINHVNSLKVESESAAPGEKPQFLGVREQRVTHIAIFVMIGLSIVITPILRLIPMPVLFGVFLYMGISSLKGSQFFDRILIMFMPVKYQPDYTFLRKVPLHRVHLFTIIQLVCLIVLWMVKSYKPTSIAFPLMLVVIIGVRKSLDFLFTRSELKILDDVMPEHTRKKEDEERIQEEMDAKMEKGSKVKKEPHIKFDQSGSLQIPLVSGNVVKIPVDQVQFAPGINITEELNRNGIWKHVNHYSSGPSDSETDENGDRKTRESIHKKKSRSSKKDAQNEEERRRLSTMTETDLEDGNRDGTPPVIRIDMPISSLQQPSPVDAKVSSVGSGGGGRNSNGYVPNSITGETSV